MYLEQDLILGLDFIKLLFKSVNMSNDENLLHYGITEFERSNRGSLIVEVRIGKPEPTDPEIPVQNTTAYISRTKCRTGCSANCEGIDESEKGNRKPIDSSRPVITVTSAKDRQCAYLLVVGIPLPDGREGNNDKAVSEQLWRAECVASTNEGREVLGRIDKLNELTK